MPENFKTLIVLAMKLSITINRARGLFISFKAGVKNGYPNHTKSHEFRESLLECVRCTIAIDKHLGRSGLLEGVDFITEDEDKDTIDRWGLHHLTEALADAVFFEEIVLSALYDSRVVLCGYSDPVYHISRVFILRKDNL